MALDGALEAMIEGMEILPSDKRLLLLEEIGRLHGMGLTLLALLTSQDHKDHEDCNLKYPKEVIDGYLDAWNKDVYHSIQLTCEANGIDYVPDPNKELRDEILAEVDS